MSYKSTELKSPEIVSKYVNSIEPIIAKLVKDRYFAQNQIDYSLSNTLNTKYTYEFYNSKLNKYIKIDVRNELSSILYYSYFTTKDSKLIRDRSMGYLNTCLIYLKVPAIFEKTYSESDKILLEIAKKLGTETLISLIVISSITVLAGSYGLYRFKNRK